MDCSHSWCFAQPRLQKPLYRIPSAFGQELERRRPLFGESSLASRIGSAHAQQAKPTQAQVMVD